MKTIPFKGIIIAFIVFFSFTLFFWQIFPSPRKNEFIVLYIALMFGLYASLCSNTIVKIEYTYRTRRFLRALIIFSLAFLFILSFTCFKGLIILKVILSITLVSMVPGYLFTKLLKLKNMGSLETLTLAFCLSIPMNAIIFIGGTIIHSISEYYLLIVYSAFVVILFIVGIISLKRKEIHSNSPSSIQLSDLFVLSWIMSLFAYALIMNYPQTALKPSDDLFDHWGKSKRILAAFQNNNEVIVDNELLYHVQWATVMLLANLSTTIYNMAVFQSFIALLSVFNILSFYMMSKSYLKRINEDLVPLATLFWTTFSGFGWIYCLKCFLMNRVEAREQYFNILMQGVGRTYLDTAYGNGLWVWLWYRPLTLGLTLFFILVYLLNSNAVGRKKLILLSSILLITLNLTHFSESFIFSLYVFLLSILKLLKLRMNCHLQEASISVGLSMLATILLVSLQRVIVVSIPLNLLILICVTGFFTSFIMKYEKINFEFFARVKSLLKSRWFYAMVTIVYLSFVLVCLELTDTFSIASVSPFAVPFVFYPFLMGVIGILALMALKSIAENDYTHLIPIVVLLFVGVFIGRIVSFLNVNSFFTGYWERRIVLVTYASLCVLAPISFLKFYSLSYKRLSPHLEKNVIAGIYIALLVLCGVSSTFLAIDYQVYISEKKCLGQEYSSIIEALSQLEYNTNLLTVTDYSRLIARSAPVRWTPEAFRYHVLEAINPELPLNALFQQGGHGVLYLERRDVTELRERYGNSYVTSHILPLFDAPNVEYPLIIKLPKSSPPSFKSTIVLVLPREANRNYWFIYDVLSQAQINYTTSLFNDLTTISDADIIVAPSEYVALELIGLKKTFDLKYNSIIVFNVDGYDELSCILFDEPTMNINSENGTYVIIRNKKFRDISFVLSAFNFTLINENLTEPERLMLLDESLDGWISKGSGSGTISEPLMYLDSADSIIGNKSIVIKVDNGVYEQWIIYKEFPEALQLENFDFVAFYWFGHNNSLKYVLQFETDNNNFYWYEFTDNWLGWKKVYLPMWCQDGRYNFNNVTFVKVTKGNPTWNGIKRVVIKLSGANVNVLGTYKIDAFGFESSTYAAVRIRIHAEIKDFKIGLTKNFININETGVYGAALPYIINGVNVYRDKTTVRVNFTHADNWSTIFVSCKLVPSYDLYKSPKFFFEPSLAVTNVSRINFNGETLELPSQISVLPLKTSKETLASYDGGIPFIVKYFDEETGLNVIYVNFYPLLKNIKATFNIIGKIIEYSHIFYHNASSVYKNLTKLPPENAVVFRKGVLSGKVQLNPESLVLFNITKRIIVRCNNKNETLTNIVWISPLCFSKISVNANLLTINGGTGFYSNLYLKDTSIIFLADKYATVIFRFQNGSFYVMSSKEIEIYVEKVSMLARFPNIILDGHAILYDIYAYPNLNKKIRPDGVDGQFVGSVKFKIIFGDTYIVSEDFGFHGQYLSSRQIYTFNDLDALLRSTTYALLLSIFFIIYSFTYVLREENKVQNKISEEGIGE